MLRTYTDINEKFNENYEDGVLTPFEKFIFNYKGEFDPKRFDSINDPDILRSLCNYYSIKCNYCKSDPIDDTDGNRIHNNDRLNNYNINRTYHLKFINKLCDLGDKKWLL